MKKMSIAGVQGQDGVKLCTDNTLSSEEGCKMCFSRMQAQKMEAWMGDIKDVMQKQSWLSWGILQKKQKKKKCFGSGTVDSVKSSR